MQKELNQLIAGIINQAKHLHLKHNCGESENLVYMTQEFRKNLIAYIDQEKRKLQAALDLLETIF